MSQNPEHPVKKPSGTITLRQSGQQQESRAELLKRGFFWIVLNKADR
jgi:hypothetical protein